MGCSGVISVLRTIQADFATLEELAHLQSSASKSCHHMFRPQQMERYRNNPGYCNLSNLLMLQTQPPVYFVGIFMCWTHMKWINWDRERNLMILKNALHLKN